MTPDDNTHTTPPDATRDQSEAALDAGLAAAFGGDTTRDSRPLGAAGEVIGGRYHLIDEVGTGGMGSVWRAEQRTPVKRYVAVKLVKAGMDSKAVLARFDAERQALAVMDHPNIARVFDGGVTADGRPYFVMELVKGTPITTFCDVRKLTPRQRLELFVPVCSAIQHAHMKGVIHRDIKPSNVLVALYDDKAVPKVIDFGVAKATGASLTEHTLHTGLGAVVGTPEYMSPEQASLNNLDIDTRSDVYALGVLLYELLTGSPPFTRQELEKAGLLELLRVVREVEPPRPSVKLSTAAAKPSIAANRGTEPTPLAKLLRSELDWVVMKALEKDRNRRYDSTNGFAADVQRYLAGEAVQAVPPSLGYRVRKWVRKNRGLVTTSGLVAASLLAGTGVATWQAIRADQEADRARQEESKTKDALAQSEKNREQAEVNLVHSYLRPIGYTGGEVEGTELVDQAELVALDELARNEDDRIKLLFLREALSDGERAVRIAGHAERVMQAAVGPSVKRRSATLELMGAKQRDKDADPRIRFAACLLAIELASEDLPALSESIDMLLRAEVSIWNTGTDQLLKRIPPAKELALAEALVGAFSKHRTGGDVCLDGLRVLAPRLDPVAADRLADILVGVLNQATDVSTQSEAARGLAALAPRLTPVPAGRGFDSLIAVLERRTEKSIVGVAADGLTNLAPRLDSSVTQAKVTHALDVLVTMVGKTADLRTMSEVGSGLVALAQWIDAPAAQRRFNRTADALVARINKASNRSDQQLAIEGLSALAPRLDSATASQAFSAVMTTIRLEIGEFEAGWIGDCLEALAPRLDLAAVDRAFAGLINCDKLPGAWTY